MMSHWIRPLNLSLVLAFVFLLGAGMATAGEEVIIDGVPHVQNGTEPSQGRRTVQLEELWRIGGDDDDVFFGLITQVLNDDEGNIYILDSQLCEVQVYSPQGDHQQTLFREGEGPGEVMQPRNLALLGDGTVGVIREFPGTVIRVDRDNNPADNIPIHKPGQQGFMIIDGCFAGGPTLAISGTHAQQAEGSVQERVNFLGIFSPEGEEIARLTEQLNRRDYQNFVLSERLEMPSFYWANDVGSDGRIYTAPQRDRYAIEVYTPAGKLERVIERKYDHYKRTQAEYQRLYAALEGVVRGAEIEITLDIEENENDILAMQHGVRIRDDHSLWILPSRGVHDQAPGVMLTFDVFDPQGHFVEQVSFTGNADGIWDGFFFVGPDRVVIVTGHVEGILAQYGGGSNTYEDQGEGSAMEVICYRMRE